MSSRLRSLDSKISFFAFADIITAVSGVLIFVALLLATDLGVPTDSRTKSENTEIEQQLQETLAMQVDVDAQNERLQELLTTAETAPDPEKLQADIKRLQLQLAEEQKKQAAINDQMSESQDAIAKRDAVLGLTDLKAKVAHETQEAKSIASQDAKVREEMAALEQHLAGVQSKLLILRQREGKLWLIPDKGSTTKEPILATVSASGVKLERFDRPDQTKNFSQSSARSEFDSYLDGVKPVDQYIVFLVRPSGVGLFEDLVKSARDKNIEVGFDALEENKDIYYSTPPVIDETVPVVPETASYSPGSGGYSDPRGGAGEVTGANGRQRGGTGGTTSSGTGANNGGNQPQSASGQNGTGTGTGTNPQGGVANAGQSGNGDQTTGSKPGSGSGNGYGAGAGNGAGTGQGAGVGNGKGNGNSKNAATNNAGNGGEPGSSTATPADAKKAPPTTSSKHTPPPQPVVKSWWQRFLDWIGYKS
jgi:hypothetical protein